MSSITQNTLSLPLRYTLTGAGLGAAFGIKASSIICPAVAALKLGTELYRNEIDVYNLVDTAGRCMLLTPTTTLLVGAAVGGSVGLIIGATRHIFKAQ